VPVRKINPVKSNGALLGLYSSINSSVESDCGGAGFGKISDNCGAISPVSAAGITVLLGLVVSLNTIDGGELVDLVKVSGVLVDAELLEPTAEHPGGVAVDCQIDPGLYQTWAADDDETGLMSTASVLFELHDTWSSGL